MKLIPLFKRLHSGESNSRSIRIELSETYLTKSARLCFVTPMGKIYVTEELSFIDGVCEYLIPRMLLDGRGALLTQLVIYENDDYVIKSPIEEYPVFSSVDDMSLPQANDEGLKSLIYILEELTKKSDITHNHNSIYYTEEEVNALLQNKSDKGHSHPYSEIAERPGAIHYSDEILNISSLEKPVYALGVGGYVVNFSHNVNNLPTESVLTLRYKLTGFSEESQMSFRYFSDTDPLGKIFLPVNTTVSYSDFFSTGFPENAGDDAFIIYVKNDGTGQVITKSVLTGSTLILTGPDTICKTVITLPCEAVEHTNEVADGENALVTSSAVFDALLSHNEGDASHPDMRESISELYSRTDAAAPTKVSQLENDLSFITENDVEEKLSTYPEASEVQGSVSEGISSHNGDTSAHSDIRNAVSGLAASINAVTDTVIETGTSGNWVWRKWASGISECWCKITLGELNGYSISSGSIWNISDSQTVNLPTGLFISAPFVFGEVFQASAKCANIRFVQPDRLAVYFRLFGTVTDFPNTGTVVNISVKGRWK